MSHTDTTFTINLVIENICLTEDLHTARNFISKNKNLIGFGIVKKPFISPFLATRQWQARTKRLAGSQGLSSSQATAKS